MALVVIPHCCGHLRKNPSRDPVTKSELSINSMVEIKFHSNILEMRLVFSKAFGTRHENEQENLRIKNRTQIAIKINVR